MKVILEDYGGWRKEIDIDKPLFDYGVVEASRIDGKQIRISDENANPQMDVAENSRLFYRTDIVEKGKVVFKED